MKYSHPREFGLNHQDIFLQTPDNIQIHGWFLPSTVKSKGTVFFLHGNAQNISAHIRNITWLPSRGYNVFLIDYRGYGNSKGEPSVKGAIQDIATGLSWLDNNPEVRVGPIFLLGQSLGASLSMCFVGSDQQARRKLSGVILDAGFSNVRTLVREKLSTFWPTWPLQYPLSLLFGTYCDPEKVISNISPVPVFIMHSDKDEVVPSSHGKRLYQLASWPKFYLNKSYGHVDTFTDDENRKAMLNFMEQFTFLFSTPP